MRHSTYAWRVSAHSSQCALPFGVCRGLSCSKFCAQPVVSTRQHCEILAKRGRTRGASPDPIVVTVTSRSARRVEARLYRFAFERNGIRRPTLLCNHDLKAPERLWVKASILGRHNRWDYAFHEAQHRLETAVKSNPNLGWLRLGETVTMSRGGLSSPEGKKHGVHTCDFREGTWHVDRAEQQRNWDHQH